MSSQMKPYSRKSNGWLLTSLPNPKCEFHFSFYYNVNTHKIVWKHSYFQSEPSYLDQSLLNREEIEECINRVNHESLNKPIEGKPICLEVFNLMDRLIRAWIMRQRFHVWSSDINARIKKICLNRNLYRGIVQLQALWRGYCVRRRYKAYLQYLSSPNLQIAGARILGYIRSLRRRRFIERTLNELFRVLQSIRRLQAVWRGFQLRRTLKSSLLLALDRSPQTAIETPLIVMTRLCSSQLVPPDTDSIYDRQLDCFKAAAKIESNAHELTQLEEEINRSSTIFKLLEQMQQKTLALRGKNSTSSKDPCTGDEFALIEKVNQKYSAFFFLLYTQPEYFARLLVGLSANMFWDENPTDYLDTCKPSEFALKLERIILSFYSYGCNLGDELRLYFLITRAFQLQLNGMAWDDLKNTRGHFVLRLGITLVHVIHSSEGTAVHRLLNLIHEILITKAKRTAPKVAQGDTVISSSDVSCLSHIYLYLGCTKFRQVFKSRGKVRQQIRFLGCCGFLHRSKCNAKIR